MEGCSIWWHLLPLEKHGAVQRNYMNSIKHAVFWLSKAFREPKAGEILVVRVLWMFLVHLNARPCFGLMYQAGADSVIHSDPVALDCGLGRSREGAD